MSGNSKDETNHPHHDVRVSFREDVNFADDITKLGVSSGRSKTSTTTTGSSTSESSSKKYSKLRSNLTREQTNRDPFFFYKVTNYLGSGSMGDVKLVKKRKVGGSARRDIQEAVQRQKREKECLNLPVVGNMFQICMDGDLKDNDGLVVPSSHHSTFSFLGKDDTSTVSRSFEDSLWLKDSSSESAESEIIYAMKSILLDQEGMRETFVTELRNEIAILKDLDHPNIVRAIETFEWKGQISIVMELCSGGDLYARDPYTEAEAARITGSILSAIAYMHSRNVVHGDLKFENVLFANKSPMSEVKLIDFGLSQFYVDKKLTNVSGTIYTMVSRWWYQCNLDSFLDGMLTFAFSWNQAPEVLLGSHTEKADMWSIGTCGVRVSPPLFTTAQRMPHNL